MIGEHGVVAAKPPHAGPHHRNPGAGDLLLEVAVVPGKAGSLTDGGGRGRTAAVVAGLEEIVVVAENGERGVALRARRDHVQQLHLGPVGQQLRQHVGVAGNRVGGDQRVDVLLHGPGGRVGRARVGVDVDVGRIVAVHRERR